MSFKLLQKLKDISPATFFLILAFIFGIAFQSITPPFQSPDEFHHFYRAYQVADGQWEPLNENNRLGGYVPESFIDMEDIFFTQRYDVDYKIDRAEMVEKKEIRLNENKKIFIDFPNTALYSPCSYIPQAMAIFICKKLDVGPLNMLYIARFASFLFWIFFVYLSIRIIPVYKWLFAFLALLPVSLFINCTVSADVVTNSLSFLTIAFSFYCAFKIDKFTRKHLVVFIALITLLSLSKLIYAALILLFFLIPVQKFKSKKECFLFFFIILSAALIAAKLWTNIIFEHYIIFENYDQRFGPHLDLYKRTNIPEHQKYVLHHPFYFFNILWNTITQKAGMYLPSYVGVLGCLDVYLPGWIICLCYLSILFTAFFENNSPFKLSSKQKLILFICGIALFSLVILSQLVLCDFIGVSRVNMIQGRYLVPAFPLLFFLFYQSKYKINRYLFAIPFILVPAILFLSYCSLQKRYVSCEKKHVTNISWNKNITVNDTSFKEISNTYFKRNINFKDSDTLIKLYNTAAYACTYLFYGAKKGDEIYVEMLKKGNSGSMVITCDSVKRFFISSIHSVYRTDNDWFKVRFSHKLDTNYGKVPVKIFLWNPSEKDTAYISGFKIKISQQLKTN